MNSKRKFVLTVFTFLVLSFGLFPPWKYQTEVTYNNVSINEAGSSGLHSFQFIFDPPDGSPIFSIILPSIESDITMEELTLLRRAKPRYSIDYLRLLIIWSVSSLTALAALILTPSQRLQE